MRALSTDIVKEYPPRSRRTILGTTISITLGASLAAVAALRPATVPHLITIAVCGIALLVILACIPRGK
jgi:hypothetical protein